MNKSFFKNILKVLFGNMLTIFAGLLTGFLLPMLINVTDYGYYKTFTLYMTYIGLFAFGIIDGINLVYAGTSLDKLNKEKFRLYYKVLTIVEVIFSLIVILFSIFFVDGHLKLIFLAVGLMILPNNLSGYFQQISQVTQRFTEYSIRNVVKSLGNIFIIVVMWFMTINNIKVTYIHYLIGFFIVNIILLIWYIHTYREIIFGTSINFNLEKKNLIKFIKIGFPLMIANLCTTFILTLDRQFVSILFSTEEYALYAFAYNLLSFVTVAISSISVVIFPMLKQKDSKNLEIKYDSYVGLVEIIVGLMLVSFFPLAIIINIILPKYVTSLLFFKIMFPSLIGSSVITTIMQNYYKSIGESFLFFKKSVIILILSIIANLITYYTIGTMAAFSVATVIIVLVWYINTESVLIKKMNIKWKKNFLYQLILMFIFYLITFLIDNYLIGMLMYIILFVILTLLFYSKLIQSNLRKTEKSKMGDVNGKK